MKIAVQIASVQSVLTKLDSEQREPNTGDGSASNHCSGTNYITPVCLSYIFRILSAIFHRLEEFGSASKELKTGND